jgi:hypothetical protein
MAYKCRIEKNGRALSGFYPNDIPNVFSFRRHDWLFYHSKKEAQEGLKAMKEQVENKDNQRRWGEKISKKHLNTFKKLNVVCE